MASDAQKHVMPNVLIAIDTHTIQYMYLIGSNNILRYDVV